MWRCVATVKGDQRWGGATGVTGEEWAAASRVPSRYTSTTILLCTSNVPTTWTQNTPSMCNSIACLLLISLPDRHNPANLHYTPYKSATHHVATTSVFSLIWDDKPYKNLTDTVTTYLGKTPRNSMQPRADDRDGTRHWPMPSPPHTSFVCLQHSRRRTLRTRFCRRRRCRRGWSSCPRSAAAARPSGYCRPSSWALGTARRLRCSRPCPCHRFWMQL